MKDEGYEIDTNSCRGRAVQSVLPLPPPPPYVVFVLILGWNSPPVQKRGGGRGDIDGPRPQTGASDAWSFFANECSLAARKRIPILSCTVLV